MPNASTNVRWEEGRLTRVDRWRALECNGATVWLTGLPASGKSTLGSALEEHFVSQGRFAYLLDGDNLRHGICGDLGFSSEDRTRNVARAGELARLFADAGAIAIVALISPFEEARNAVRDSHRACGLPFVLVHIDTPLEVCLERDPKGLYARARTGEVTGMTGIDSPYEPPSDPDLRLTGDAPIPEAVDAVLETMAFALSAPQPATGGRADLGPPRRGAGR